MKEPTKCNVSMKRMQARHMKQQVNMMRDELKTLQLA